MSDDTVLHLATAEGLATGELHATTNPFGLPGFGHTLALLIFKQGIDCIDLIVSFALTRSHQDTHHTLPSHEPWRKAKPNLRSGLDLLLYYVSVQVGGKRQRLHLTFTVIRPARPDNRCVTSLKTLKWPVSAA